MITVSVRGENEVERMIRDFARLTGRTIEQEMIATARLVAVSLATSTQPYGKDKDSRAKGEGRVSKDIRRVFRTPSSVFLEIRKDDEDAAERFWRAHKSGDLATMRSEMTAASIDLEIAATPDKSIHQAARNSRGRTAGSGRAKQLITQKGALEKYIAQRQKKVGFAKAGWAAAADQIGGHRGVPAWASGRHPTAPGSATIQRDPLRPRVVLRNDVSYISQVLPDSEIQTAVGIAFEKLMKRLAIVLRKASKKAA